MENIRCDKCGCQAVVFQKYSGMHLCQDHLDGDLLRKVRETLRETKIFGRGAKIAVALSGSQESLAMLYILKNLFARRRDIELVAVMVDEGIGDFRSKALYAAGELADSLDVQKITRRFDDILGFTADGIARQSSSIAPCTFCRTMRDGLLIRTTIEIGGDALATGQSLDDMAEMVMGCYLCGETDRMSRSKMHPLASAVVPMISPLMRVPRDEIALYAGYHFHSLHCMPICPYAIRDEMRQEVRAALNGFEQRHPGTKYSLLRSLERIRGLKDRP